MIFYLCKKKEKESVFIKSLLCIQWLLKSLSSELGSWSQAPGRWVELVEYKRGSVRRQLSPSPAWRGDALNPLPIGRQFLPRVHTSCCLVAKLCPTLPTPWTVAHQAPLSLELARQEYWSGQPCPSPGDLLYPRIKLASPHWQEDSLPFSHLESPRIQTTRAQNEWVLILGIVSSLLADFSRTDLL